MVIIREVKTRKDRLEYVEFPNKMYKDVPQYVPCMVMDEMANINEKKNPAFSYCDMRFFLAEKNGKTVGRIGGIISHKANNIWNTSQIRITRMDFIEDYEVFVKLIETIEEWGRKENLSAMIGPIGFCDLDKEGMLIDGFDQQGMFITYYNYPYYAEFMERYGFEKAVDWTEHKVYIECEDIDRIDRIAERVATKNNFRVLQLKTKADLKPYIPRIFELLNSEYKELYGVVPLSEEQIKYYAGQFLSLINLRYISLVVNENDELVALGILAPSLVDSMKKCNGRLFPTGWIGLLKDIRKPRILDMYLVAVKGEYRKAGVPAILMTDIYKRAKADDIEFAETGPELELNTNVQTMWEKFRTDYEIRRRRCWTKNL